MNRHREAVLGAMALLVAGCATMQQAPQPVQREVLVRVWASTCEPPAMCMALSRRYQGALIYMDSDSLTLLAWREPDPVVTLPIRSIEQAQLYRGMVPSAKAALRYGAVGLLAGAASGALLGAVAGAWDGDPGLAAAQGATIGAATGLTAGVLQGVFEGEDHWEAVQPKSLYTLYCLTNEKADCESAEFSSGSVSKQAA